MKIRRLVLDVDKARERPTMIDMVKAIENLPGVEGVNITVDNIDIETVGMNVIIEGVNLDYDSILEAIEATGAVVHSIDQIVSGDRMIEYIQRIRGK